MEEEHPREKRQCFVCLDHFATVQVYHCKKCSHVLENAPSELQSCRSDLESVTATLLELLETKGALHSAAVAEKRRHRLEEKRALLEQRKRQLKEADERIAERKFRLEQLRKEQTETEEVFAEAQSKAEALQAWNVEHIGPEPPLQKELRLLKKDLVAQLFGLLPVFPTLDSKMRVVNFEIPEEEEYHLMDPDECATVTSYFVKLSALLGRYLEISLPNTICQQNHRWAIRARGAATDASAVPPVPLHPRTAGVEPYRLALALLEQNVVRLCYDQGISIRSGHEHRIARNLHYLVSYTDGRGLKVGLGYDGPWTRRVVLPEEKLAEEGFVIVSGQ